MYECITFIQCVITYVEPCDGVASPSTYDEERTSCRISLLRVTGAEEGGGGGGNRRRDAGMRACVWRALVYNLKKVRKFISCSSCVWHRRCNGGERGEKRGGMGAISDVPGSRSGSNGSREAAIVRQNVACVQSLRLFTSAKRMNVAMLNVIGILSFRTRKEGFCISWSFLLRAWFDRNPHSALPMMTASRRPYNIEGKEREIERDLALLRCTSRQRRV